MVWRVDDRDSKQNLNTRPELFASEDPVFKSKAYNKKLSRGVELKKVGSSLRISIGTIRTQ